MCCTTENRFSQLIFIPHGLQNKIFLSVEKTCSPNSETNNRIRATNELFSLGILKKKSTNIYKIRTRNLLALYRHEATRNESTREGRGIGLRTTVNDKLSRQFRVLIIY
jgi:hypothetical protein